MNETRQKSLTSSELNGLREFGVRVSKFGINFGVYDSGYNTVLYCDGGVFESDADRLKSVCSAVLELDGGGGRS